MDDYDDDKTGPEDAGAGPKDDQSEGSYEVGYRKPPKHAQFKPGQSGNPRGRPKGSKNLWKDIVEELEDVIIVRENGEDIACTKQQAIAKSLVNRAITGDVRVLIELLRFAERNRYYFRRDSEYYE